MVEYLLKSILSSHLTWTIQPHVWEHVCDAREHHNPVSKYCRQKYTSTDIAKTTTMERSRGGQERKEDQINDWNEMKNFQCYYLPSEMHRTSSLLSYCPLKTFSHDSFCVFLKIIKKLGNYRKSVLTNWVVELGCSWLDCGLHNQNNYFL